MNFSPISITEMNNADDAAITNCAGLMMVGFEGKTLPEQYEKFLSEEPLGGVILFSRNIKSTTQLQKLCSSISRIEEKRGFPHPLSIAIDQEGGLVNRLENIIGPLPSALSYGIGSSPEQLYDVVYHMSRALNRLGFHINFAPVVDLYYPLNQQIQTRSFGEDPQKVNIFAQAFLNGSLDAGIIPCLKHFPGLGPCLPDTHLQAGVIKKTATELTRTDLVPFQKLLPHSPAVMVSHASYSAFKDDTTLGPASLSTAIITTILRHKMAYKGLVFSDDMEMNAIAQYYTPAESAAQAIAAGSDMVLFCHSMDQQIDAIRGIQRAVREGRIAAGKVLTSLERLRECRMKSYRRDTGNDNSDIFSQKFFASKTEYIFQNTVHPVFSPDGTNSETETYDLSKPLLLIKDLLPTSTDALRNIYTHLRNQLHTLEIRTTSRENFSRDMKEALIQDYLVLCVGKNWDKVLMDEDIDVITTFTRKILFLLTGDPAEAGNLPAQTPAIALYNFSIPGLIRSLQLIIKKSSQSI